MALHAVAVFVTGHRDTTIHALHRRAAAPAQRRPRIAAAVDQHEGLRLLCEALLNSRMQGRTDGAGLMRLLEIFAQIDNLDARERPVLYARSQRQEVVFSVSCMVI